MEVPKSLRVKGMSPGNVRKEGRKASGFGQSTMANGAAIEFRIITEIELIFAGATLLFE